MAIDAWLARHDVAAVYSSYGKLETAEYAASIGADGFAPDASVAVDVVKQQLALA